MNKNVPKLRFKEFNEEWIKQELDSIVEISKKKYNPIKSDEIYKCIELEHIAQIDGRLLGYVSSKEQASIKNKFDVGDVLFGKLRPYLRKYWIASFEGVCSSEIWALKGKSVCNQFLYTLIQGTKFNVIANISAGSKMPRADWNYMSTNIFSIPSLQEQEKIADFFTILDSLIEEQDGKVSDLELYKKGMMQKIFSQEIRFKDENGCDYPVWETKELGNLFNKIRNGFVGTATPYYVDRGILYLQSNNIRKNKFDLTKKVFVNEDFHNKNSKSILQKDDILMVQSGHVGECAVVTDEFVGANCHALIVMTPIKNINSKYYAYYINSDMGQKKLIKIITGNTIKHILASDIKKYIIESPCLQEQNKIVNFLSNIDNLIEEEKRNLDDLREMKKGLLQQMFV